MDILVRDRRPEDLAMVFDSWLKSWRTSKWAGVIPNHLYFETQRVLIEDLIARGASIKIAYPSGREDIILGWACGEEKEGKTVLHYLYTKDPFIGLGIPELLLNALPGAKPGFVTHKLHLKETKEWRHTPEIARRKSL
jgi:hypothetical protein